MSTPSNASLALKTLTTARWPETLNLSIPQEQRHLVPSVNAVMARLLNDTQVLCSNAFCIEYGDMVIGFFTLAVSRDEPDVCFWGGFQIDQQFQGQGLGRQTATRLLRCLPHHYPQCKVIRLDVHHQNEGAIHLYQSLGFYPIPSVSPSPFRIFQREIISNHFPNEGAKP